ncbi:MAG TPA: molecular chaperone SurA, partial [Oxalobacteraceae bacterium]|nr:molecular chaperone SurA [Oxalobacteraceae bacterium]
MSTHTTMHKVQNPIQGIKFAIIMLCLGVGILPGARAETAAPPAKSAAPAATKPKIQVADTIVAVVNSEVITRHELNDRVTLVEQRMKQQGIAMPPAAEMQKQLLERLIVDRAQLQLAKELGIHVDDTMLDRAVARIAEQNKMTLQAFRDQVEREGTSFAKFREEIRDEITMQRVREREVDNKIQITESEVDNELAAEAAAPQTQQEFNLAQILVRIPENASAEQIGERRKRAEDILGQLGAGGDFARLAATYSDSIDALKGGELGWRSQDRLPQLFVDAVANLKQGEVSAIVKSANGFHILKVLGKRGASVVKVAAGAAAPTVQQTHARHILIKVNQVVTAADARRKLTELKLRLDNKSATFEELAKLYSNDLSASKGGDLGWIYPGDTVPEFERAMDALKPGEISGPVESPFGFHLIQVLERKTNDVSQERQRMAARMAIRERKLEEATQDWL